MKLLNDTKSVFSETYHNEDFSEELTNRICLLLDLDVHPKLFQSNLQLLELGGPSLEEDEVEAQFKSGGPHAALKQVLNNRLFIQHAISEFGNVVNVVILLTSASLINFDDVSSIIKGHKEGSPVPNSKYLTEIYKYCKDRELTDSMKYALVLLLYCQSPNTKARLVFDTIDINNDGYLSGDEIKEVLESGISKAKINVNSDLIEELCNTLGEKIFLLTEFLSCDFQLKKLWPGTTRETPRRSFLWSHSCHTSMRRKC